MSHIVIHDDNNGVTQYRQFDDLQAAVGHLEDIHNSGATERARLFELNEVEFEVKSYIKVEIGGVVAEPLHEVTHIPVDEPEIMPAVDEVEYVEAAIGPIETMEAAPVPEYTTEPADDSVVSGQGEARRGLFGR